jgi:hypothetical protein
VEVIHYFTSLKKGEGTDYNNYRGMSLLSTSYKILSNILLSRLSPLKLLRIISDGLDVTDQLRVKFFPFVRNWRKKWGYNETVHELFTDFKKAYDSVRRKVVYKILIQFEVPMKIIRLIKIRLNETYSEARIGKNLSNNFPIQNAQNKEMPYRHCFSTLI